MMHTKFCALDFTFGCSLFQVLGKVIGRFAASSSEQTWGSLWACRVAKKIESFA